MQSTNRRKFLQTSTFAALSAASFLKAQDASTSPIKLALKYNMVSFDADLSKSFAILKEIGYDGVELDAPGGQNKIEALAASKSSGLPIHGVVDSIHWSTRLSDPEETVREKALEGLLTAIRESHSVGGTSVLLVPAVVDDKTTHDQAWERSIAQIRKALPLALGSLGIFKRLSLSVRLMTGEARKIRPMRVSPCFTKKPNLRPGAGRQTALLICFW